MLTLERILNTWGKQGGSHLPCLEHGVLEGTGVGEGHVPRVGALVHGVEVECRLQLRLASGQEHDACVTPNAIH